MTQALNQPSAQSQKADFRVVAIVDSSGSMSSYWKYVVAEWNLLVDHVGEDKCICITFDTTARTHQPGQSAKLDTSLYKHGGGGTVINAGFKMLEDMIDSQRIPTNCEIKIIFVSDGQDNHLNTL
jgi:uncharacterized sporulation protein YeaH/YhbH (DUF444 family)